MDKKEKNIKEIVDSLGINEEIKSTIFEYILLLEQTQKEAIENISLKIPHFIDNTHQVNRIFNLTKNKELESTIEIDAIQLGTILSSLHLTKIEELPYLTGSTTTHSSRVGRKKVEQNTLASLQSQIEDMKHRVNFLSDEMNKIRKDSDELKDELYNISKAYNSDSKIQYIPIDIYLDTDENATIFEVYDSILRFLESIEFIKAFEFDAQKGSWFKKMVARSKKAMTSDEVYDRLKEAEYGVEVNTILKQQSEIDKNQSEALLNILKSIETVPKAAIRIGSLLVVKLTNESGEVNVQVRSLTIQELHLLNKQPELLHKPTQILQALTKAVNGNNENKN